MQAGSLRHPARFQRQGQGEDGYGNVAQSWADLFSTRANLRETPGKERIAAGALEALKTATLRLRANSQTKDLTPGDRVWCRGQCWKITGIALVDDKGRVLDLSLQNDPTSEDV